jgi:hypothetical protein
MGWKSFHLNGLRKGVIVAHAPRRIRKCLGTAVGLKFGIAIADEKRIILSMLDRLRVGWAGRFSRATRLPWEYTVWMSQMASSFFEA